MACLAPAEKLKLTQVEMGAYAHLFGLRGGVHRAADVDAGARLRAHDPREAFDALTNFAAEEVKHMMLFREVRAGVDAALGFPLALLPGAGQVARAVLSKHPAAVLLLTAAIEWLTQLHYLSCFEDDDDARSVHAPHLQSRTGCEESQHARHGPPARRCAPSGS